MSDIKCYDGGICKASDTVEELRIELAEVARELEQANRSLVIHREYSNMVERERSRLWELLKDAEWYVLIANGAGFGDAESGTKLLNEIEKVLAAPTPGHPRPA